MISARFAAQLISASVALAFAGSALAAPANGRFARGAGLPAPKMTAGSTSGSMGFKPYSGSYLPRSEGPLAKENDTEIMDAITNGYAGCDLVHKIIKDNAAKSTAAKFEKSIEKATGADSDYVKRYKATGYSRKAESWEGFCHNWAPAGLDNSINFMVSMDKIYADVPFGIGDLRELATFNYPGETGGYGSYAWFGKRHDDKDKEEKPEDSLDPVDLISIFQNFVGKGKPGIVMDVDPGYMVWNQPFFKWKMNSKEVSGTKMGPKKPPVGGKAFKVKLVGTYGLEGQFAYRGDTNESEKTWNAFVYTDKSGKIVDSAWDMDPNGYSDEIPDFAWMNLELGNNADYDHMRKIASEGISVKDIETFCATMTALPNGNISKANAKKLSKLLDKICPVLDQNKVNAFIRETATRTGQDYTVLDGALHSDVDAHS